MKKTAILLLFVVSAIVSASQDKAIQLVPLESVMSMFDRGLEHRTEEIARCESRIDSMKAACASMAEQERGRAYNEIAEAYGTLQVDSAIVYCQRMMSVADSAVVARGEMLLCRMLPLAGRVAEAVGIYEGLRPDSSDREMMTLYHATGEAMYRSLLPLYGVTADPSATRWQAHSAALMEVYDDRSPERCMSNALYYYNSGKPTMESANLIDLQYSAESSAQQLSKATLILADLCRREHVSDSEEELHYLLQSAVNELRSGITTGEGLAHAAIFLQKQGDKGRAYRAMVAALANASYAGDYQTMSLLMPHIGFLQACVSERVGRLHVVIGVCCAVIAVLVMALVWLWLRKRRIEGVVAAMSEAEQPDALSDSQREFTVDYLNLHAAITEKYEETLRTIRRKLSAGQIDDLHRMLKSGNLMNEQAVLFNNTFDRTTLTLFPDFVEQINALLIPDRRIALTEDGQLTTELRILALARLGIDDTAMIARFLGLSHNTIYTYRNRLRSRALSRDDFMEQIRAIR